MAASALFVFLAHNKTAPKMATPMTSTSTMISMMMMMLMMMMMMMAVESTGDPLPIQNGRDGFFLRQNKIFSFGFC